VAYIVRLFFTAQVVQCFAHCKEPSSLSEEGGQKKEDSFEQAFLYALQSLKAKGNLIDTKNKVKLLTMSFLRRTFLLLQVLIPNQRSELPTSFEALLQVNPYLGFSLNVRPCIYRHWKTCLMESLH
jgi:hypothetical protein